MLLSNKTTDGINTECVFSFWRKPLSNQQNTWVTGKENGNRNEQPGMFCLLENTELEGTVYENLN